MHYQAALHTHHGAIAGINSLNFLRDQAVGNIAHARAAIAFKRHAKETRLALKLTGILASSDPDVARAIIEAKKKQDQYAVGDELPIDKVKVAKILHDRVVLDNKGRYELLMLFDEDGLSAMKTGGSVENRANAALQAARAVKPAQRPAAPSRVDQRGNNQVTAVAENYRRRLYNNPQSLSDVVKISAVRKDGQLQGYRVSAGRARDQFESLGFKPNDIVTAVRRIRRTIAFATNKVRANPTNNNVVTVAGKKLIAAASRGIG